MNRTFKLDLFGTLVCVILPGLVIWLRPHWVGIADAYRGPAIAGLCVVFVVLFLAFSLSDSLRPTFAWLAVQRWVRNRTPGNRSATAGQLDHARSRAAALKQSLADRHGWRWRYRDRWLVVAADEALVRRLAPGLADKGFLITGSTVLLYAKQTNDALEWEWLDQIRRLRRRCPVDAIAAVTLRRSAPGKPFDADDLAQRLARHARALRWAAPAYLLNVTDFDSETSSPDEPIGFTWANPRTEPEEIDASLQSLIENLADAGVVRLTKDAFDRYPAELSHHIESHQSALSTLVRQTARSHAWRHAVHGLLFAPLFDDRELAPPAVVQANEDVPVRVVRHRAIWETIAGHSRTIRGRRVGLSLSTSAAWLTAGLAGCWIGGMVLSGSANRATAQRAADTVAQLSQLSATGDPTQALRVLDEFDRQLDTLEIHQRDGAPWTVRFGLNRDGELLDALWPSYADAANRILVAPIRRELEARLRRLAALSDAEIASGGAAQVQAMYDTLKAYLMLSRPDRSEAAFLTSHWVASSAPVRPANSPLSAGTWKDLREHAIAFFSDHLSRGVLPAMTADAGLVASARQTVISVRGIQNSTDALYQDILEDAKLKYPPVSLATLLGDTTSRGLFNTTATVPGVFTRAAWDERISRAIDEASEQRNVAGDWVLSEAPQASNGTASSSDQLPGPSAASDPTRSTLKADLRRRYFADYARAWAVFLNSLRWQPAPTLSATADQLALLGDSQRSPLVALMRVVAYQASTGANLHSLADNLINKAQQLVGANEQDPSKQTQPQPAPLVDAFGPILRLTGSDLVSGALASAKATAQPTVTGDLSLARYLERTTAMRLKVSQIVSSADPDARARLAAQAVLQGKTSDLADSRDYASRLAASLGEQWAGFGAVFRAPFEQTWGVVVQPAASSLNEIWRGRIVADWNERFGGRYPFADSDNDASLPDMARFMQPDNGVIAQFVTTHLAGVVERQGDRWVAAQGADDGALTIDPAFLAGLNTLSEISTVLVPFGDARIRYELQAVPIPGVTEMKLVSSGRELHYFNQKQEWMPFEWPGQSLENRSRIEWQTAQGGLRTALDSQGQFGLIRLLEQATVSQQDSSRYLLSFTPDTSQGATLKVQLRSAAGAGPLDVLRLRHFTLPPRIFITGEAKAGPKRSDTGPPPLPASAIEAAAHAATPLPPGMLTSAD